MSKFKPLKWLVDTLVWIIRGTPLMLQLILVYYGPGLVGKWAARQPNPGLLLHPTAVMAISPAAFILMKRPSQCLPNGQIRRC